MPCRAVRHGERESETRKYQEDCSHRQRHYGAGDRAWILPRADTMYPRRPPSGFAGSGEDRDSQEPAYTGQDTISSNRARSRQSKAASSYGLSIEEAAKVADFIVECINEKKDLKIELFKLLDSVAKPDALFGSNTSYLNVFELVPASRAANTVITHWFAPPHILPLVEVVREERVSKETEETVLALLRKIGKTPILMQKYVPGHVINRFLRIMGREVFFLLDNGYITSGSA